MSGRVVLFAKNKKIYTQRTFSSEMSQIFQSSFSNTFGRLLPRKKNLQEAAVRSFLK